MLREFPEPLFCGFVDSNSMLILRSDGSVFSRGLFALMTEICILKPNHISGASNAKSKENMGRKDEGQTAPPCFTQHPRGSILDGFKGFSCDLSIGQIPGTFISGFAYHGLDVLHKRNR